MKRGAESVEDENQRIALLCNACESGSLEDVVHALESCDVNVIDSENGLTPLMYACSRFWKDNYETTKEIVHTLIQRGALINAVTFKGSSTLSLAILNGCSTDIVELLIDNKAYVNSIDSYGNTPLMYCADKRDDEEGSFICVKLMNSGADITKTDSRGSTAFFTACARNTLDMVQDFCDHSQKCATSLLSVTSGSHTMGEVSCLMAACRNNMYGPEIIDYLIRVQKLDVFHKTTTGKTVFDVAMGLGGRTAYALCKYIPAAPLGNLNGIITGPDPISTYKATAMIGYRLIVGVGNWAEKFTNPEVVWAYIRTRWIGSIFEPPTSFPSRKSDDEKKKSLYYALSQKEVPERVRDLLLPELTIARFGNLQDTILHIYARQKDVLGLISVMKQGICPFMRNTESETPMGIAVKAQSKEIITCLSIYSRWHPDETRTRWYGPYFRQRAKTFLLVAQRLGVFPKDIRLLIVRHIADCEDV